MDIDISPRMQKILWFGVSTAIVGLMVYFADFNKVVGALQQASLGYMTLAFVFGLSVFGVWSYTWHNFFQQMQMDIEAFKTFKMFMAGQFFNSVTPLGQFGGEPFMAYVISKNTEYSAEKAFSAVLSADIINAIPPLTFVIGGILFQFTFEGSLNQFLFQILCITLLTLIVGGAFVYTLWFKSGKIESTLIRILNKIASVIGYGSSIVENIEERLYKVEDAFSEIGNNPKDLFKALSAGHIGFLFHVLCLAAILTSLNYDFQMTSLFFTITLASLASFSPTPGGSGTFEAAMAGLLTLFTGIEFHAALLAAILFRVTTYWPGILIGYLSFNSLNNEVKP